MRQEHVPFRIVRRLDRAQRELLIARLEAEVRPRLERRKGGYASGRQQAWIGWQPALGNPASAAARPRGALWDDLQAIVPGFETALCWLNGEQEDSSLGIRPHRDAGYAAREAWIVNLAPCEFRIWIDKRLAAAAPLNPVTRNKTNIEYAVNLVGDEVIAFDCKDYHGSKTLAASRWGIGLWTFNPDWARKASLPRARGLRSLGRT